jgi:hypothetical protein
MKFSCYLFFTGPPGGPPPPGAPVGAPGGWAAAPQAPVNCPPGLEYLASVDQLLVKQKVEGLEGIVALFRKLIFFYQFFLIEATCTCQLRHLPALDLGILL